MMTTSYIKDFTIDEMIALEQGLGLLYEKTGERKYNNLMYEINAVRCRLLVNLLLNRE